MEQTPQFKWTKSDVKMIVVISVILMLLKAHGLLDNEFNGYPIQQHVTGFSWLILIIAGIKRLIGKL